MSSNEKSKLPRASSKRSRFLPIPSRRAHPGLAIDTSFAECGAAQPKQVYPLPTLAPRTNGSFVSLSDIQALSKQEGISRNRNADKEERSTAYVRQGPQKRVERSYVPHNGALWSAHASTEETPPPPPYKDVKDGSNVDRKKQLHLQEAPRAKRIDVRHRPAPLKVITEISPSARDIPIGIAVSSASARDQKYSLESAAPRPCSSLRRQLSQGYGQVLETPTIVITPAEENFDRFGDASYMLSQSGGSRPRSSVYSRYTDCTLRANCNDRTPPVPALPSFVLQSGSASRPDRTRHIGMITTDVSQTRESPQHDDQATSICTDPEGDDECLPLSATTPRFDRTSTQSHLPTPRRSKGWWNVLTSPFTTTPTRGLSSFSTGRGDQEKPPVLNLALGTPFSGGTLFRDHVPSEDEPRSAPPTGCGRLSFATPKRSDTAPGALDLGNAGKVNIYRTPSGGAASSYFDASSRYPSLVASRASEGLDRQVDPDWSPSQSVYRGSRGFSDRVSGFANMPIPTSGEAASYYDSSRAFPSIDEREFHEKRLSRGGSAYPVSAKTSGHQSSVPIFADRAIVESPAETLVQGRWRTSREDECKPLGCRAPSVQDTPSTSYGYGDSSSINSAASETHRGQLIPSRSSSSTASDADVHPSTFDDFQRRRFENEDDKLSYPSPERYDNDGISDGSRALEVAGKMTGSSTGGNGNSITSACDDNYDSTTPSQPGRLDSTGIESSMPPVITDQKTELSTLSGNGIPSRNGQIPAVERECYGQTPMKPPTAGNEPLSQTNRRMSNHSESTGADSFDEKQEKGFHTGSSGKYNRDDQDYTRPWYKRAFTWLALCGVLLIALLIVLLVKFIPTSHSDMPVEARWLNLTGFPPIPTGIATVVGSESTKDITGCVNPSALWSCAVPARQGLSTTRPDQPNFRFLIRFRNGTLSNSTLLEPVNNITIKRHPAGAANAAAVVKRSAWSSYIYTPSPPPPSTDDQKFLGRTSDGVRAPYNGEETPFYISLLDPVDLHPEESPTLKKRGFRYPYPTTPKGDRTTATSVSSSSPTPSTSDGTAEDIPSPVMRGDGAPILPQLYPLASAQPLRLFDRGQQSEHYGFYTYFDRVIYVSDLSNDPGANSSSISDRTSGNVRLKNASAACTWSQTRMHVQIWTQKASVTALNTVTSAFNTTARHSTANDMRSPGSFPYAVTISLDRHGGDPSKKGVYCYSLDEEHHVLENMGSWISENRAFGGGILSPAKIPANNGTIPDKRGDSQGEGIDGGTSGCACQWQNV